MTKEIPRHMGYGSSLLLGDSYRCICGRHVFTSDNRQRKSTDELRCSCGNLILARVDDDRAK